LFFDAFSILIEVVSLKENSGGCFKQQQQNKKRNQSHHEQCH